MKEEEKERRKKKKEEEKKKKKNNNNNKKNVLQCSNVNVQQCSIQSILQKNSNVSLLLFSSIPLYNGKVFVIDFSLFQRLFWILCKYNKNFIVVHDDRPFLCVLPLVVEIYTLGAFAVCFSGNSCCFVRVPRTLLKGFFFLSRKVGTPAFCPVCPW